MNDFPDLVERAVRLAAHAHAGQTRKTDGTPYIAHPVAVALRLVRLGARDVVVAAALVHDVLEDTEVGKEILRAELGDEVTSIVTALTHDDTLTWEEKKRKYIASVRAGSDDVKLVSLMDKIHNLECLIEAFTREGDAVWSHFNRGLEQKLWFEKEMLVMFQETWQHPLIDEYASLLSAFTDKTTSSAQ